MAGWIDVLLALLVASPAEPPAQGYCVHCHAQSEEPRLSAPAAALAESVHASLEDRCIACHGGDAREPTLRAHDATRGFRGKPTARDVPLLCGGCHSDAAFIRRFSASLAIDQLALYRVSGHAASLARGEDRAATCISCHGAHDIRRVNDAKSSVHPLHVADTCGRCHGNPEHPAAKLSQKSPAKEWRKSVHAEALLVAGDSSAPTCNDCHGDHGASPPGVSDIHRACGSCHAEQSERFQKSPHQAPYRRLGFGECAECHGRHDVEPASDAMLAKDGVCARCHDEDDAGARCAVELRRKIVAATASVAAASQRLEQAKRTGLFLPDAEAEERELGTALRKLRIAVHNLDVAALAPELAAIEQSRARIVASVDRAEGELHVERRGYLVFIGLLALMTVLLWLKLRRLSP
jgi:hypothetical protein